MEKNVIIPSGFLNCKNLEIHILRADLATHVSDEKGREMWWFGSDPPDGIPSPKEFIEAIEKNSLRKYAPPWAAVVKGAGEEGIWACTDPIGLEHLFIRNCCEKIIISTDGIASAAFSPAHLNPVAAYELIVRGNPQRGRTLFSEVTLVDPAIVIQLGEKLQFRSYWQPPELSPIDFDSAVDMYTDAVKKAVVKQWKSEDMQELTAGKDSMLVLSALLSEDLPIQTWTHGMRDDEDMVGAQERANIFGISHKPIFIEPTYDFQPDEIMDIARKFLRASNGLANILPYWNLPWVIHRLDSDGSISGVCGEAFRGFYYKWACKGMLPRTVGEWFLLHGKIREEMFFDNPIFMKEIGIKGRTVIKEDLKEVLKNNSHYWYGMDGYYLMQRMHHCLGTICSASGKWGSVRAPLADPLVLDCFPFVPIELREHSRLVDMATQKLLKSRFKKENSSGNRPNLTNNLLKVLTKTKEIRGAHIKKEHAIPVIKLLNSNLGALSLDTNKMLTRGLYNIKRLKQYTENLDSGHSIPSLIGAILTIELAAREIQGAFAGIDNSF